MIISIPSLGLGVAIGFALGIPFWFLLLVGVIWRLVKSVKIAEVKVYKVGLKGIESLKYLERRKN